MEPPPPRKSVKPPLITPSASPPPPHHLVTLHRRSESSPPSKRQRIYSTPVRSTYEGSTRSSSRPQSPVDVQKEREASKIRLLDVWASLAERYTRRLDEDDIVDIRTGEITKDNGVLRSARKLDFGALAAPAADYTTADEDSDTAEEDDQDEYDLDELDSFASVGDYSVARQGQSELEAGGKVVPPVAPLDPADAADLQEFMDAERLRKDLCGSEIDDDDSLEEVEEGEEEPQSVLDIVENSPEVGRPGAIRNQDEDTSGSLEAEEQNKGDIVEEAADSHSSHIVPRDLPSEDELDNWNVDETNIVHPVSREEDEEDSDSDIEIIEPPIPATHSSPRKTLTQTQTGPLRDTENNSRSHSKSPQKQAHQLYTPPQSSSSFIPSTTPERRPFGSPSPKSSSASVSRSSKPFHTRSPSKSTSKGPAKIAEKPTPVDFAASSPIRVDLSKVQRSSKFSRESVARQSSTRPIPDAGKAPQAPKLKPYVLLTPRKAVGMKKAVSPECRRQEVVSEIKRIEIQKPIPSNAAKGKGKARAWAGNPEIVQDSSSKVVREHHSSSKPNVRHQDYDPPLSNEEGDDPITISSSPTRPKISSRSYPADEEDYDTFIPVSTSKPRASSSRTGLQVESSGVQRNSKTLSYSQPNLSISDSSPRKRKRVVSDSKAENSRNKFDPESPTERQNNSSRRPHGSVHMSSSRPHMPIDDGLLRRSLPQKRSSSRRRQSTPESLSGSDSASSRSPSVSETTERYHGKRSHSRPMTDPHSHYSWSHSNVHYPSTHHPPREYVPIPDPRAQLIITQAMQQLSALVGAAWPPPQQHDNNSMPRTPSHRHHSSRPSHVFSTPTHHHHPQPYYDPNLSHATLPPDSPEFVSSPEKSSPSRRKSLVRRSRSRGRRVSFKFDEGNEAREAMGVYSSPIKATSSKHASTKERRHISKERSQPSHDKRRATSDLEPVSDNATESDIEDERGRSYYVRAQTPGPKTHSPPRAERRQSSSNYKHESRR